MYFNGIAELEVSYSGTSEIRTLPGPCKSVLISEVSLIQRFPYNSCNIMLYNSGPWTLVRIVEVSVIGGVHFRRFHCISELSLRAGLICTL